MAILRSDMTLELHWNGIALNPQLLFSIRFSIAACVRFYVTVSHAVTRQLPNQTIVFQQKAIGWVECVHDMCREQMHLLFGLKNRSTVFNSNLLCLSALYFFWLIAYKSLTFSCVAHFLCKTTIAACSLAICCCVRRHCHWVFAIWSLYLTKTRYHVGLNAVPVFIAWLNVIWLWAVPSFIESLWASDFKIHACWLKLYSNWQWVCFDRPKAVVFMIHTQQQQKLGRAQLIWLIVLDISF